jgi:hypothetical protein
MQLDIYIKDKVSDLWSSDCFYEVFVFIDR